MLRSDVEQPLTNADLITDRLDAVDELLHNMMAREELREYLNPIYDLERLNTRIVYQTANPRDLLAFKNSVAMLPAIKTVLADFKSKNLVELSENIDSYRISVQILMRQSVKNHRYLPETAAS